MPVRQQMPVRQREPMWQPEPVEQPVQQKAAANRKISWWERLKQFLEQFFGKTEKQALLEEKLVPKETEGTTLLTGGMIGGGIYCLRARNLSLPNLLLTSFPFFVGKDEKRMDGVVEDTFVSRYHARFDRDEEGIRVMDLGSTNGTFLNRERLQPYEARVVKEGDLLVFAQREYEFCFLR